MDKILVTIYVLTLGEEYDVLLPINISGLDALKVIQETIKELSLDTYEINPNAIILNEEGLIINLRNTIRFSGLKNGSKVILR